MQVCLEFKQQQFNLSWLFHKWKMSSGTKRLQNQYIEISLGIVFLRISVCVAPYKYTVDLGGWCEVYTMAVF
jgi:hypothetical protein